MDPTSVSLPVLDIILLVLLIFCLFGLVVLGVVVFRLTKRRTEVTLPVPVTVGVGPATVEPVKTSNPPSIVRDGFVPADIVPGDVDIVRNEPRSNVEGPTAKQTIVCDDDDEFVNIRLGDNISSQPVPGRSEAAIVVASLPRVDGDHSGMINGLQVGKSSWDTAVQTPTEIKSEPSHITAVAASLPRVDGDHSGMINGLQVGKSSSDTAVQTPTEIKSEPSHIAAVAASLPRVDGDHSDTINGLPVGKSSSETAVQTPTEIKSEPSHTTEMAASLPWVDGDHSAMMDDSPVGNGPLVHSTTPEFPYAAVLFAALPLPRVDGDHSGKVDGALVNSTVQDAAEINSLDSELLYLNFVALFEESTVPVENTQAIVSPTVPAEETSTPVVAPISGPAVAFDDKLDILESVQLLFPVVDYSMERVLSETTTNAVYVTPDVDELDMFDSMNLLFPIQDEYAINQAIPSPAYPEIAPNDGEVQFDLFETMNLLFPINELGEHAAPVAVPIVVDVNEAEAELDLFDSLNLLFSVLDERPAQVMVQAPVDTLCTTADVEELDVLEGLSPLFPELDESIGRTLVQTATDLGEGEVHDAHDPDTSGLSPANPIVLTDVEGNIAEKVTLSIVSESKGNDRAIEEAVAEKEDVREQEEKLKKMKTPSVNGRYQAYEASQSASKPLISGLMFDFGSGPWPFAEPGEVITTTPASSTPTRGSANLLGSPLQLQSPTTFNVYRRQKDPFVTPTLPPPPDNWCQPPGYNRDNTLVSISVESTPIRESHPDAPYNESITLADNVSSDSPPKPARWKGKERAVEDRCNLSSLSHARQRTSSARGSPRYEPYRPSAPTPDAADRRYSRHSRRYSDERSVGTLSTRQSPNMRRSVEQSPSNSVSPSLARSRLSSPALMRPAPPTLSRMKVKDRTHWVPAFTRRVSEIRSPGPCTRSSGKRVSRTSGRPPPVPSRSALIQNEDRRSQSSSIGAIRGNRGIPSSPSSLGSMAEISLHSSPPPRPSAPSPASDVSQVRRPHLQPMYSLSSPSEPPESPIALPQRPSGLCPGSASSSPNRRYLPALLPSCSPRTVTDADPSSPNSFGRIPSPVVPMKRPSVPSPGSVSSGSSSWYLPTLLPSCSPSSRTDPDLLSPSNSSQLSTPPTGEIRWQLSPELTQQEPTSPVEPPARPSTPVPGAIPSPDSRPTSLMLRPESVYSIDDQLFFRYDAMRRPDKAWAIDTYRYAFRLERAARGERVLPDYGKDTLHKLDGRITNQSARVRAELKRQEFMDHEDGRRAVRRLTRTMGAFGLSEGDGRPEEWGRVAQEDEEEPDWDEFSIDSGASSSACQESVGFPESGVCFLRPKNAEEESDPRLVEAFNAALEWGLKSYDPEWDPPQHPNRRIREDMYRFWRRKLQDLVENPVEHAFEGTPTLPP